MHTKETFYRGAALGNEPRSLPAATYNLMRLLFQHCGESCLFVPVRSMQYQAIIDQSEIIFVDAYRRTVVEFAWQKFNPQSRNSLTDPVPYQFVYYDKQALETMPRMQGEFMRFLYQFNERQQRNNPSQHSEDNIIQLGQPDDTSEK